MSNDNFKSNDNTESAQVAASPEQQVSLVQSVYSDTQAFSNLTKSERDTNTDKNNGKDGFLDFPSLYPGEGSKHESQFPKPSEDPTKDTKPSNHGGLEQGAKEKPPEMTGIPGRPDTQKPEDGGKFGHGGMEMPQKDTKPTEGGERKPENNDKEQQKGKDVVPNGNKLDGIDLKGPFENNYPKGEPKPNGDLKPSGDKFEHQERKIPDNKGPFGELKPNGDKYEHQERKIPDNKGPFGGLNPAEGKLNPSEPKPGGGRGPMDHPPSPNDAPVRGDKKPGTIDQNKGQQKETLPVKPQKRYYDLSE